MGFRHLLPVLSLVAVKATAERFTNVSMIWPIPDVTYDAIQNNQIVSSNGTEFEDEYLRDRYHADSPCQYISIPSSVSRVPFPSSGGRIQLKGTSPTWHSSNQIDRSNTGEYWISIMLTQLEGKPLDDVDLGRPWRDTERRVALFKQQISSDDFELGNFCSESPGLEPLQWSTPNITRIMADADLEGVHATVGVRIEYYPSPKSDNVDDVEGIESLLTQCTYVTLSSILPDAAFTCSPKRNTGHDNSKDPSMLGVGLGVGPAMFLVMLLAVFIPLWMRRRRKRRAQDAIEFSTPDGKPDDHDPSATSAPVHASSSITVASTKTPQETYVVGTDNPTLPKTIAGPQAADHAGTRV